MKTSKNAKVWLVLFAFAASFMMACATTPPALPETTGEELGVYLLDGKVVDAEGNEYLSADGMAQYYLDAAGNVVTKVPNKKGKLEDTIVVSAAKMTAYTYFSFAAQLVWIPGAQGSSLLSLP